MVAETALRSDVLSSILGASCTTTSPATVGPQASAEVLVGKIAIPVQATVPPAPVRKVFIADRSSEIRVGQLAGHGLVVTAQPAGQAGFEASLGKFIEPDLS